LFQCESIQSHQSEYVHTTDISFGGIGRRNFLSRVLQKVIKSHNDLIADIPI